MDRIDAAATRKYYQVVEPFCSMCGLCVEKCPLGAIQGGKKKRAKIHAEKCNQCGVCLEICPYDAIKQTNGHEKLEVQKGSHGSRGQGAE